MALSTALASYQQAPLSEMNLALPTTSLVSLHIPFYRSAIKG